MIEPYYPQRFLLLVECIHCLPDVVLAVIPIVAFWKLQMRLPMKVGICKMMGLTFLSAIFTIIKAIYLRLLFEAKDTCESRGFY